MVSYQLAPKGPENGNIWETRGETSDKKHEERDGNGLIHSLAWETRALPDQISNVPLIFTNLAITPPPLCLTLNLPSLAPG
jgi:hypothetical protein